MSTNRAPAKPTRAELVDLATKQIDRMIEIGVPLESVEVVKVELSGQGGNLYQRYHTELGDFLLFNPELRAEVFRDD